MVECGSFVKVAHPFGNTLTIGTAILHQIEPSDNQSLVFMRCVFLSRNFYWSRQMTTSAFHHHDVRDDMSVKHGFVRFPNTFTVKEVSRPIKFFHPTKIVFQEHNQPHVWTSYNHRRSYKSSTSTRTLSLSNLQFLKGLLFFIGSFLFVAGGTPSVIPAIIVNEKAVIFGINVTFLIGSTFFVAGAGVAFWISISAGRDSGASKWIQPRRIDYWSNLIQLVGALFFQVNSTTAVIPSVVKTVRYSRYLIYLISTVASINFVTASYIKFIEAFHKFFAWRITSELWWEIIGNLVGSWLFLIASLTGLISPNMSLTVFAGFLIGSIAFMVGSALKIDNSTRRVPARAQHDIICTDQ